MRASDKPNPAGQGGVGSENLGSNRHGLNTYLDGTRKADYQTPGFKGPDGTSQSAAMAIAPSAIRLRYLAMKALQQFGDATALEAATASGVAREALQPRFSELRAMGLVEATGARRRNPSGKSAAVLRLTEKGKAAL